MRETVAYISFAVLIALGLWGLNTAFRNVLWRSLVGEAAALSQIFADQAALALSFGDEVALRWAVQRAVMGKVLYAQVVVGREIRAQDRVADLGDLDLSMSPPEGEFEAEAVFIPGVGRCVDVRRKLYGRGGEAGLLLGYVRMGDLHPGGGRGVQGSLPGGRPRGSVAFGLIPVFQEPFPET